MKTILLSCIALLALACDDAQDPQAQDPVVQDDDRPLRPGPCRQHDAVSGETLYHQYMFDDAGRMTQQTILPTTSALPGSTTWTWAYSEAGFLTEVCESQWEEGLCERWMVDADGTPVSGEWERWIVEPYKEGTIAFDAQGRRTEFTVLGVNRESGEPELQVRQTFEYADDRITIRDHDDSQIRVTVHILDADGRVTERRFAPSPEAEFVVQATLAYADGRLSTELADGVRTTFSYDLAGNLLRRTRKTVDDDVTVEDTEFEYGCFDRPELDLANWAFDEGLILD